MMKCARFAVSMLLAGMLAGCAAPPSAVPTAASAPTASAPTASPAGPVTYPAVSAAARTGQHPHTSKAGDVNFLLYLPAAYATDQQKEWPLILYLHGSGEKGNDVQALTAQPLPETLAVQPGFPFIVASPQLGPEHETWAAMIEPLEKLLDELQRTLRVDRQRVYLTGLSLGGAGAWELALHDPGRFAAVVPIAGFYRGDPNDICALKDIPTWVFHGAQDTIVPPSASQGMVEALKACGGDPRFTLYPDADHIGSWREAYAQPELYTWMLSHSLK
jgi:predicted peptidase